MSAYRLRHARRSPDGRAPRSGRRRGRPGLPVVLLVVTALGGVGLPALAADRRPMAALPATVAGVPQQVAPRVTRPAGTPPVTAFPVVRAGLGTPEPGTGYQPQVTCDPRVRPGVAAFRQLMLSTYGGADAGITRACTRAGSSEHEEGRAWDWQLSAADPAQRAVGDAVLDWLMAPGPDGSWAWQARRFGIMYVIWNGRIWGVYRADEGWRAYRGSDPHTTHVHFSFSWDGALKRTSWWTGRAVTTPDLGPCVPNPAQMAPRYTGRVTSCPPPAPSPVTVTAAGRAQPVLAVGSRGGPVRTLQQLVGVSADGIFGPVTEKALRSWQAAHGLAPTGIADAATWTVLLSAAPARGATSVRMSPAAPSTARSPSPGASPVPRPAVRTPSLDQLRYGASGPAVRALQARLVGRGLLAPARATGSYDRATRSAVAAFQRAQGWRGSGADGLVGPLTVARLWA